MPYDEDRGEFRDYTDQELDAVRDRINILDYAVSSGVRFPIRNPYGRRGAINAFCPFHQNDRTPALAIYPDTNSFNCFSCKAGGDVIKFIMLKESLDFLGAVQYITGEIPNIERRVERQKREGLERQAQEPQDDHTEAFCSTCQREPTSLEDFVEHAKWHRDRDEWIKKWWDTRGVSRDTVEALQLGGYVNGRSWATIPIISPDEDVIGARKRSTNGTKAYRPWRKGEARLEKPYAIFTSETPRFYTVVEGEIKNIVLVQFLAGLGYEMCGLTGFGAQFWPKQWGRYIQGELFLLPDPSNGVDDAGEIYQNRVLESVGWYGQVVQLPAKVDDMINAGAGNEVIKALGLPTKPQERMI
jgi:hypothetical protein